MAKRGRKPVIKPHQIEDWLKRRQQGESPPKIAERDSVDVRTVRKHLREATEEKAAGEARSIVLSRALENHYNDLCDYISRLNMRIAGKKRVPKGPTDGHLEKALREHIPRSPIWRNLRRLDETEDEVNQAEIALQERIEAEMNRYEELKTLPPDAAASVKEGAIKILIFQGKKWARDISGYGIDSDLTTEPAGEGYVTLRYGPYSLGRVSTQQLETVKDFLIAQESRLVEYEELNELKDSWKRLAHIRKNLEDELAVYILKRVVPGHCRYCPF